MTLKVNVCVFVESRAKILEARDSLYCEAAVSKHSVLFDEIVAPTNSACFTVPVLTIFVYFVHILAAGYSVGGGIEQYNQLCRCFLKTQTTFPVVCASPA